MKFNLYFFILLLALAGCKNETADESSTDETVETVTPVTVTNVTVGALQDVIELNATSSFLLKTTVKSNTNGYLQAVNAQLGKYVSKGQDLFVVKTKEAENLGNTVNLLDSSFHFTGVVHIKSPGNGYITQLAYTSGDYVQDGEQLVTISDVNSFVFLLDLPYELKAYLSNNKTVEVTLADGEKLTGILGTSLPMVDSASQTQRYIIKVNSPAQLPENLIAKVKLVKSSNASAVSVPKAAVLTDEAQNEFWIMKLINDSTAVKVTIQKGLEDADKVEIVSPVLQTTDRILLTGNYGLSDTAKVIINKN